MVVMEAPPHGPHAPVSQRLPKTHLSSKTPNIDKITEVLKIINSFKIKTKVIKKPLHAADVLKTYGDNRKVKKIVKKLKFTNYKVGVRNTVKWYKKNSHL